MNRFHIALATTLALAVVATQTAQAQPVADEIDPAAEDAFFTGVALLEAGDARGAVSKFDLALRLQPNLRRVLYYRSRAWMRLGDMAAARRDADAYGAFPLEQAERDQLATLRGEIEARAKVLAGPSAPVESAPEAAKSTGPSGLAVLAEAEALLARGDCKGAEATATRAMAVDGTLARAFLVKGLALECLGELPRAQELLGMYGELRHGMPADPVAAAALARIRAARGGVVAGGATAPPPKPATIGDDPKIGGLLDERWGASPGQVSPIKRVRAAYVADVGQTQGGEARLRAGGSNAIAQRAWVFDPKLGLLWSRLRIAERSGPETPQWLSRVFGELHHQMKSTAGVPDSGVRQIPTEGVDAAAILGEDREIQAMWKDGDRDVVTLRLGRCAVHGDASDFHPDTQHCVELVGHSGQWVSKAADEGIDEAARRLESPGRPAFDFVVGLGAGFGVDYWRLPRAAAEKQQALGGQFNGDLLIRGAKGPFVFGAAVNGGIVGHSSQDLGDPPLADLRVLGQVGVRAGGRQRQHADIALGLGVASDERPAFAASLRMTVWWRTADLGRVHLSFEPGAVFGPNATTISPLRITFGGAIGTRWRPEGYSRDP